MLKISTITSTLNAEKDIDEFVHKFSLQKYKFKELVVVDGGSADSTYKKLKKLKKRFNFLRVFKKNKSTIYEALNYGIKKSNSNIINILGSDDSFINNNLFKKINKIFNKKKIKFIYGNCFYEKNNKIIRIYSKKKFSIFSLDWGFMPAHTTLFVEKKIYEKLNYYSTNYKFASDFEFCLKLFQTKNVKYFYYNNYMVSMKSGGVSNSSLKNIIKSNIEVFHILNNYNKKLIIPKIIYKLLYKFINVISYKFLSFFKN